MKKKIKLPLIYCGICRRYKNRNRQWKNLFDTDYYVQCCDINGAHIKTIIPGILWCVDWCKLYHKGKKMCEHKWNHFETRYLYEDNYPSSSEFKRIDRFFCEKCCEEKVLEKSCYDYEDRHPEWFNWNNYERIQR